MSASAQNQEPLDFLKNMWGNMGFPLPGMVTPTVDTNELDRRIADLKAVEGWLRTNLSMLQMTIQGLEMQRNTLATMQAISQSASAGDNSNPFANPAMWPWNLMQQTAAGASPFGSATSSAAAPQSTASASGSKPEKPKKD